MDNNIFNYVDKANILLKKIIECGVCLPQETIKNDLDTLYSDIRTLQTLSGRLAYIANIYIKFLKDKKELISTLPKKNDHISLLSHLKNKTIINENGIEIKIQAETVDNIHDIPSSKLYYVKSLDEYAVNINGLIIKGNLLNIMNKPSVNSKLCEKREKCKDIKTCSYYHPPEDYIRNDLPLDPSPRNVSPINWLYDKKKPFTRKIGGRNTLLKDIQTYNKKEDFRQSQLIHDILIYNILHSNQLLPNYEYWSV